MDFLQINNIKGVITIIRPSVKRRRHFIRVTAEIRGQLIILNANKRDKKPKLNHIKIPSKTLRTIRANLIPKAINY
jgi:hypothetical protein